MEFGFSEEQMMFRDTVYRYAKNEIADLCEEADLKSEFSREIWNKLGALGLLGLPFPEEYGGQGADVVTCCLSSEALSHAGVDGGHMLALGAHTYLCGDTIFKHGTEEQKRKYVPKLASGEWIGCMGLTEPEAGSDAASLQTTAVKKNGRWILNGTKTFITNAPVADVAVIYATVDKKLKHSGITAFIVERSFKGFSTGKPFHKMCVRASATSEVFLEDCEVPEENILGEEGKGFAMTHQTLEWDRSALLAPVVGGLMYLLEECAKYANQRIQFGKPIREFQAVQHKIADIKIILEACRLAVYRVAALKDAGHSINHLQASIAKAFTGDWGLKAFSEAVQVFGGYGLMHEYPVEWFFRDAKLAQIGGGTSEIQKMIISRLMSF
ncbi:MAG TPA: acyl-CoA dehydrogenase family protein [Spirochaetota bacterium]|nr:acyl-CoA dehydrogenase family protein [Spirochaetota bacterium]HPJ39498.1 acyl-CoA dehydrogenase family protein [Spirochaetota bacterium]HPQ53153.1 acyl-CoA dehydrogenase family protein [Spirochaetota bacterium]